jgi:adenylate kinase family enzyme
MNKQFFILLGRSGSGKGTQAALLKNFLEERYKRHVVHVTTGGGFRDFITHDTYASSLAKHVNDAGGLQPEFLAVWNWSNIFINTLQGEESVILDGAPRKPFEASILHSAVEFFGFENPTVIYLDVSESESRTHLAHRAREDDKEEQITRRMQWFDTDVLQVLDVYRNDPRYRVVHVNGNQTIEEVFEELREKLAFPE